MTRTITLPELVDAPPANDPFCFGSRYVVRARPDGTLESDRIPLTIWDVMHPQEGDHIVQSTRHAEEVGYLASVIRSRIAHDKRALLLNDTPIYWDKAGLAHHSPDVAVLFDLRRQQDQWTSFFVSMEGVRPAFIIEVVSPHVRQTDTVTKLAEYHVAQVPLYVIVDREREEDWPTIRGYTWEPGGYKALALDDRDCLLLPVLNLRLCANQNRVTLYDAMTGEEMGDYTAVRQALEAETLACQKAEEEARLAKEHAEKAEEEARLAQEHAEAAEAAQLKAEEEARKAEEEKSKAEAAALKAEEEARKAEAEKSKAEVAARKATQEKGKAEATVQLQADALAEMRRRLDELEAKLLQKPEA